jgi:hypothetical protein
MQRKKRRSRQEVPEEKKKIFHVLAQNTLGKSYVGPEGVF